MERGSELQIWADGWVSWVGDSGEALSVEQDTFPGFIVQHEQRPPNAGTPIKNGRNHFNQSFMDKVQSRHDPKWQMAMFCNKISEGISLVEGFTRQWRVVNESLLLHGI